MPLIPSHLHCPPALHTVLSEGQLPSRSETIRIWHASVSGRGRYLWDPDNRSVPFVHRRPSGVNDNYHCHNVKTSLYFRIHSCT